MATEEIIKSIQAESARLEQVRTLESTTAPPLLAAVAWGAVIGLLSGLTGLGGGIFLSPLLLQPHTGIASR